MMKNHRILIKNIYCMLAYAFENLRFAGVEHLAVENFEHIHELFAAILARGIGLQVKRGLYREYVDRTDNLTVMRGKIDLAETVKQRAVGRNILTCRHDEFSEDNFFNRILKTAAGLLLRCGEVSTERRTELKKEMAFFGGIEEVDPRTICWKQLRFQRHNQSYQLLLGICRLICQGLLLTDESGSRKLASFLPEEAMHRLYEKFLLNYYRREHPELHTAAEQIPWALDEPEAGDLLPVMQTDITLSRGNRVLIIDAKYYSHTLQTQYEKSTIHSANLYQIFTYVKNREAGFPNSPHRIAGLLLYAGTDEALQPDCCYRFSGNQIQVRTLDLNRDFALIAADLDAIAADFFGDSAASS